MSFKGIAWAGNVYEKFEAMCLEVEEAMYQDTVKYMENQVQKVGVSVKKFYSEVMNDLSPLTCVDPTSLDSDDLSLVPHGSTDGNKKPKPSMLLKKANDDQIMSHVTAEKGSSPSGYDVNLPSPQSPGIFIEDKSFEKWSASKKIGVHRRPIGIKRISKNNHPSKESSRDTSVLEDKRSKVENRDRTISRLASDSEDVMTSSDVNGRCEAGETLQGNAPTLDNSIESPASDEMPSYESVREDASGVACDDTNGKSSSIKLVCKSGAEIVPLCNYLLKCPDSKRISTAEPMRQIKDFADFISPASEDDLLDETERLKQDPESTSSCPVSHTEFTGWSMSDTPSSVLGSGFRRKVCNLENEKGLTVSDGGESMKDGSSSASSTPGNTVSSNKHFIASRDNFEMELVENEEVDVFETSGTMKMEESCILVEGDELHYGMEGTRKHKSYKKRIREALSSKLKSRKDGDKKKPEEQKLSANDSGEMESDWELL